MTYPHQTDTSRSRFLGLANIKSGSYTGDGATSLAITGVGFRPVYVKIWPRITTDGTGVSVVETTTDIVDDNASGMAIAHIDGSTPIVMTTINRIISLDADGFTVDDGGGDLFPNANGVVYNYLAIGGVL